MSKNYILKSKFEIFYLRPIPARYSAFSVFASGAHQVRVMIAPDKTKNARNMSKNYILKSNFEIFNLCPIPARYSAFSIFAIWAHQVFPFNTYQGLLFFFKKFCQLNRKMIFSGIRYLVFVGIRQYSEVFSGIQWYSEVFGGIRQYWLVFGFQCDPLKLSFE